MAQLALAEVCLRPLGRDKKGGRVRGGGGRKSNRLEEKSFTRIHLRKDHDFYEVWLTCVKRENKDEKCSIKPAARIMHGLTFVGHRWVGEKK